MIRLPAWLANLLADIGLARRVLHIDACQRFHLTLRAVDAAGAPVAGAEVTLERAPEWAEQGPQLFAAGRTGADGRLDAHTDVFWAYEAATPRTVIWPRIELVVRKPGGVVRRGVDPGGLPLSADERVLDAGDVVV